MANRRSDVDLREAQVSAPQLALWLGLAWPQYHSCSAQEDGTDAAFRNVGSYTQDAGEIPRRLLIAFGTQRKLENYKYTFV